MFPSPSAPVRAEASVDVVATCFMIESHDFNQLFVEFWVVIFYKCMAYLETCIKAGGPSVNDRKREEKWFVFYTICLYYASPEQIVLCHTPIKPCGLGLFPVIGLGFILTQNKLNLKWERMQTRGFRGFFPPRSIVLYWIKAWSWTNTSTQWSTAAVQPSSWTSANI